MDNETFETLTEVLAFECANDPAKSKAFSEIFYGRYKNSGASFLNLDASMSQSRDVYVFSHGKAMPAYVTSCDWTVEDRGAYMGMAPGGMRIRVELKTSSF